MDWDLTAYFPAFNGEEMHHFMESLTASIMELEKSLYQGICIHKEKMDEWIAFFRKYDDSCARVSHLNSYVGCLCAADSSNDDYLRAQGRVTEIQASLTKLNARIQILLGSTNEDELEAFLNHTDIREIAYALRRMYELSKMQMSQEEENLAADLGIDGIQAWSRLYDTLSGQLSFSIDLDDGKGERTLPMSQRRSLLGHPDRKVRRAAFENGNASWQTMENVAGAALNAISGIRHTLNKKRGVAHFLDVACFQSGITRASLDAMIQAVLEESGLAKRYLNLLSKKYDKNGVTYYDLEAPLITGNDADIPWDQCCRWVSQAFHRTYPKLGVFFDRLLGQKWVDYNPRPGKRPGGFCSSSKLIGESRIFMTYVGSINDLMTLAHEVGHAFHSHLLKGKRGLAKNYPMTLAESASTFAELIFADGMLKDNQSDPALSAMILNTQAQHAGSFLLDIPVRFIFEKKFYEARQSGQVPVSRIKSLMSETQHQVFGNSLQQGGEDPLFWASKLHFYIDDLTFYNFPYTFGFLISRSLFGRYKEDGIAFFPVYEEFMRRTGSLSCEELVKTMLGEDLTHPSFWKRAIKTLQEPIGLLESYLK